MEPFGGELEVEAHKTLRDIFAPGTWRIDGCRERKSVNHDKILADIEASGKDSAFAAAVCPFSGVTALHACAINGYLSLLKVLPTVSVSLVRARGETLLSLHTTKWVTKR